MKSFITNKVVLKLFVLIFFINQINADKSYANQPKDCGPDARLEPNVFNPGGPDVCVPNGAVQ